MEQMQPFTKESWGGSRTRYGFGIFILPIFESCPKHHAGINASKACGYAMRQFIGHGGSDYGSYILAGYHPTLNIGLAVGMNKVSRIQSATIDPDLYNY
jgi:hypothetical protein